MTVRAVGDGSIELANTCPSSDAEPLLRLVLSMPGATIDWRRCRGAHAAVVQVLMAAKPKLLGPCGDGGLETWVAPAIAAHRIARSNS